jgi:flavodoxin
MTVSGHPPSSTDNKPEAVPLAGSAGITGLENQPLEPNGLAIVGARWPHLLVGVLLAMGIFGITADPADRMSGLIWLPPALLLGWVAINVIFAPRPPKAEKPMSFDDEWDDAEDERLAAKSVSPTAADGGDKLPAAPGTAEATPAGPAAADVASFADYKGVVILWGSETGTAEGLAGTTAARLKEAGIDSQVLDAGKVNLTGLQTIQRLLLLTSTWGDGEPPSNAIPLWEALQKGKADLKAMQFSICALGDTGYPQFCQCGKDFDSFLAKHGATRLAPRVDCDLEFEGPYETWINSVLPALQANPVPA